MKNGGASKERQCQQGKKRCELRVDGAVERLHDRKIDHLFVIRAAIASQVFSNAVEDHNRIVH